MTRSPTAYRLPPGAPKFWAADGAGGDPSLPSPLVQSGDVAAAPGKQDSVAAGGEVGFPRVNGGVERVVTRRCGDDPVVIAIPLDGHVDAAAAQLLQRSALARIPLADVLGGAVPV